METSKLLSASDLAVACQVDLKTVHNWVDRGRGPAFFRTPGRHLRFKAEDVAAWLQRHGYPVPQVLEGFLPKSEDEKLAKDLEELATLLKQMSFVERGDLLEKARKMVTTRTGAAA